MKEHKFNKHTIKIYEDIKELPINRYKDFQKYLMQDAGIGSSMKDVDQHFKMLDRFLSGGKLAEAAQERDNLHMNLYMLIEKISITHISFCCLIHSLDGQEFTYKTEQDLSDMAAKIGAFGLTQRELETIANGVKKKSILI